VPDVPRGVTPRALTTEEVDELVDAFVQGGRRAMEAGFDAVQLHGAHGWMINQFLSPYTNRREDMWGGSTEGRIRFVSEVLNRLRALGGPEFPIFIKQGVVDYVENGLQLEDGVQIARLLCEAGMDAVEPSVGVWEEPPHPTVRLARREHTPFLLEQAAAVKSAVKKPVMVVGGLRDPRLIQQILDEGHGDMISLCRPFIREPHLLTRWKEGDQSPAACISCGLCDKKMLEGPLRCRQDHP
jgi:2,4-dienoyl-CoA reductase-like NADH-dependent reductase (Old Yellow Enzyme family)